MLNKKTPFLDKLYMLALVLLPSISQYKVGPLDLDVVIILAFLVAFLYRHRLLQITPVNKKAFRIVAYIALITFANLLIGEKFSPNSDIVLRTGRYCLYLMVVFFLGSRSVNYTELMRIYRVIAYAASFYIMLQAVFYYGAGITLPNKIGGNVMEGQQLGVGRLRSFYSEPAELGYNLLPFIVCSLFGANYKKSEGNRYIDALIVTVAVTISTSGQGVVSAAIVWGLWILSHIVKGDIKAKEFLLVVGVAVATFILYESGILEFTLGRVETDSDTGAIAARSSGYQSLALLSPVQMLFGTGFGNYVVQNSFNLDVVYEFINYSTIAEFLFTLGILGTMLWLVLFLLIFRKGNACVKLMIVAMLVLSIYGCPMTGKHFPLWLTLMCIQLPEGIYVRQEIYRPAHEPK